MMIIRDVQKNVPKNQIGGKAENLRRVQQAGFNVPRWIVIPADELTSRLPLGFEMLPVEQILKYIWDATIPTAALQQIEEYFSDILFFAVRSSALVEDGTDHSFAGQFESHLFVPKDKLPFYIKKVWASLFSDRIKQYTRHHKLQQANSIAVIVQAMVPADVSGVTFGINPVTGNRKEKVINAVYGLGEGLVSGMLDADQFDVKEGEIVPHIANKQQRLTVDWKRGGGTYMEEVDLPLRAVPSLSDKQVHAVYELLTACEALYNYPLDIEFAFANETLYLLQVRPITTISKLTDRAEEYILWDNSNIIESYPGVTTPLTFSFVSKSYEGAYKLFCSYLGVTQYIIDHHASIFANTLGLINGRIYYNLKSWYLMLAMLPGYSINARYMEQMMGVKEKFDVPAGYKLSKAMAWWRISKMGWSMVSHLIVLPFTRKKFVKLLNTTIATYKAIDYAKKDAHELMHLYIRFEHVLLNQWKAPLLNDFFAMIFFGTLEKKCKKLMGDKYPTIHNDLLCGSADIISTQPIHRCLALSEQIISHDDLKSLFTLNDAAEIWQQLLSSRDPAKQTLKREINKYLHDFGERCVGELKLETISYAQDPSLFIKLLQIYVSEGVISRSVDNKIEKKLRADAEWQLNEALKGKPFERRMFGWLLKRTRTLVSARENLRYERTRAFGVVREIFTHLGKRFHNEGIIEDARDIFYLGKEEIFAYIDGRSIIGDIKLTVALRKAEYETYRQQDAPAERFATYGVVYHANDYYNNRSGMETAGDLKGIGCCPGKVRAKVRVLKDPAEFCSLEGDILVTSSTDPGWTTLFPSASGIIVERGSLLSHSAIVSREMGKPCIVGVRGLLKRLKTGDMIEMDGSTGEIKLIII